jgi:putative endonuclease
MGRNGSQQLLEARETSKPNRRMWYVYILKSKKDNRLYVGSTDDLKRRLTEHREGRCKSTRPLRPLELEANIAVRDEPIARELEKYLKTGSGIAALRKRILASEVRRT